MHGELLRKSTHAALAVVFIILGPMVGPSLTAFFGTALFTVFAVARLMSRYHHIFTVPRSSYGELFFALGVTVSAVAFLPEHVDAYIGGLLVLGFADPLAALVGTRFGSRAYTVWGDTKSIEGSMAAAITSSGILLLMAVPVAYAFFGGLLLMIVEACTPRGGDNLVLPLIAGLIIILI